MNKTVETWPQEDWVGVTAVTGSLAPDGATIVVSLSLAGAVVTLGATAIFRSSERRARELGLLDRTTGS